MTTNIYMKNNSDWDHEDKGKYGFVEGGDDNLSKRLRDSGEEHSEKSVLTDIWSFEKTEQYLLQPYYNEPDKILSLVAPYIEKIEVIENLYNIELPILRTLNKYLVKSATKQSTEFIYKNGLDTLENILQTEFPKLGLKFIKKYSHEELQTINTSIVKRNKKTEKSDYEQLLQFSKKYKNTLKELITNGIQWFERNYQTDGIKYILDTLVEKYRIYLELATGGGKSYIIYKVISHINPEVIIIFSPRKKINQQNSSGKYISILDNNYLVYNCSEDTDFEGFKNKCKEHSKKMLIVACPQGSNEKVYNLIHDHSLSNIFIWFDEAHNTIEKWVDDSTDTCKNFLLNDKDKILNRVFTSASPDRENITNYPHIFGEHYLPIKVKELIDQKWLCEIDCKILEYEKDDFNLTKWILDNFIENNRKFGFSFHNRDDNAFNLFYKHYQLFKNNETDIMPYILINSCGLNENNKKKYEAIECDLKNIKHFENKINTVENPKHMAYVVKQYDMGYDFEELDYIVFSDPKLSFKDVIQSIGRGTRCDKKGENGTNLDKKLLLMLPTFITEEENNKYRNVIEVLRYLVLDLEIDIEKMLIKPVSSGFSTKESNGLLYNGNNSNSSKLLDLLQSNNILNKVTYKTLKSFCQKYEVYTEQDYYKFKELNPSLNLKNNLYEYPGFYWKNVVDSDSNKYYSTLAECIESKRKIIKDAEEKLSEENFEELLIDIEDNSWKELNKYDSNIPPYYDLNKYYPEIQ
jgi:superfamily II DNA or RNA helicase